MKYIQRAFGYFVHVCVLVTIIFGVLILAGILPSNVEELFDDGWKSVGYILLVFAAFSAIYPRMGYNTQTAHATDDYSRLDREVKSFMEERGYVLKKEDRESMVFVHRNILLRITGQFCDHITFTRTLGGYDVEGRAKDVTRIIYAFGNRFSAAADNAE